MSDQTSNRSAAGSPAPVSRASAGRRLPDVAGPAQSLIRISEARAREVELNDTQRPTPADLLRQAFRVENRGKLRRGRLYRLTARRKMRQGVSA